MRVWEVESHKAHPNSQDAYHKDVVVIRCCREKISLDEEEREDCDALNKVKHRERLHIASEFKTQNLLNLSTDN